MARALNHEERAAWERMKDMFEYGYANCLINTTLMLGGVSLEVAVHCDVMPEGDESIDVIPVAIIVTSEIMDMLVNPAG